jgi:hypothetical protein
MYGAQFYMWLGIGENTEDFISKALSDYFYARKIKDHLTETIKTGDEPPRLGTGHKKLLRGFHQNSTDLFLIK